MINRTKIREVNRSYVMRLCEAGLTRKEWDQYLDAYYQGSASDIDLMQTITAAHPALADIRWLPPRQSTEHIVLRWLLQTKPESKELKPVHSETRVEEMEDAV
jgi:hypothetical protein